jgi:alpha-tubulin suppressor-like RCC1 family protein
VVYGLAAGGSHACGIFNTDGLVYCWGDNDHGQLGTGDNVSLARPEVAVDLGGKKAISVAAGFEHSCAVVADGEVYCWGANDKMQLGDGTTTDRLTPVLIDGGGLGSKVATGIYAGFATTCADTAGSWMYCWGDGDEGQYGTGGAYSSGVPMQVNSWSGTSDLAIGVGHSCGAIGGAVYCSGEGGDGQLGDGLEADDLVQVTVDGISGMVVGVSVGFFDSCAVTDLGKFYCWGDNTSGQLGDGASGVAKLMADYGSVVPVASGYAHNCAGFYCIGENGSGQLGDGSTVSKDVMTSVDLSGVLAGLSVKDVAAGFDFTCWVAGEAGSDLQDAAFCSGSLAGSDVPVAVDVSRITPEAAYITLGADVDEISFSIQPNGGINTDAVTLTVTTNNSAGYGLTIKAAAVDLVCAASSATLPPQATGGAELELNRWGYGTGLAEPTAWYGVTTSDAALDNLGTATPAEGKNTKIWFAAQADYSLPACNSYKGTVTYTASVVPTEP